MKLPPVPATTRCKNFLLFVNRKEQIISKHKHSIMPCRANMKTSSFYFDVNKNNGVISCIVPNIYFFEMMCKSDYQSNCGCAHTFPTFYLSLILCFFCIRHTDIIRNTVLIKYLFLGSIQVGSIIFLAQCAQSQIKDFSTHPT